MNPVDWAEFLYGKLFVGRPTLGYLVICGSLTVLVALVVGFVLAAVWSRGVDNYQQKHPPQPTARTPPPPSVAPPLYVKQLHAVIPFVVGEQIAIDVVVAVDSAPYLDRRELEYRISTVNEQSRFWVTDGANAPTTSDADSRVPPGAYDAAAVHLFRTQILRHQRLSNAW